MLIYYWREHADSNSYLPLQNLMRFQINFLKTLYEIHHSETDRWFLFKYIEPSICSGITMAVFQTYEILSYSIHFSNNLPIVLIKNSFCDKYFNILECISGLTLLLRSNLDLNCFIFFSTYFKFIQNFWTKRDLNSFCWVRLLCSRGLSSWCNG